MVGKKLLGVLMSLSLALGSVGSYGQAIPSASTIPGATTQNAVTAIESSSSTNNGTVDLAIADDEKLIEMLTKSGKISKDASPEEAQKALKEYLKGFENDYKKDPSKLSAEQEAGLKKYKQEAVNKGFLNSKDNKVAANSLASNAEQSGKITKDKCLVILMEFPDLLHNNIPKDKTYMYYTDYTKQHYQDMVFGKDGYSGPNGQNLISLKQYYDQQSGSSYDIEGNVVGWYKAANNAAYYGADKGSNHNVNVKDLIKEALVCASKDVNLADYDVKDPYDLDGDGNIDEPDGIVDHLMVIHSGMGQEAGAPADAIWAHSSKVDTAPWKIPGTNMSAYPYTCMPEDGAAGVFCHEFGHDLGVADEYDTVYSGAGSPIGYWTVMGKGSWGGLIRGSEPTGFSPYAKQYFQKRYGGNWQHAKTIDIKDITSKGDSFILDQASIKGKNNEVIKVTLPQKERLIVTPPSGSKCYFGGQADEINNSMTTNIDLTNAKSSKITFKTWYNIEKDYDYASIKVKADGDTEFKSVKGNITTTDNPNNQNPGNGITGTTDGKWVDAEFDLSAFAGKKIDLQFSYWTDPGTSLEGFYVDDINVVADGKAILSDNADGTPAFTLKGFSVSDGKKYTDQYYMLEWRNHTAADAALAHIAIDKTVMVCDPGLLVYYVDESYTDNWTGPVSKGGHPGEGYIGLVDADQGMLLWQKDGKFYSPATDYLMHDAAFSLRNSQKMNITLASGHNMIDNNTFMHPFFDDSRNYLNVALPDAGRNVPKFGLKIYVTSEAKDRSTGTIVIKK